MANPRGPDQVKNKGPRRLPTDGLTPVVGPTRLSPSPATDVTLGRAVQAGTMTAVNRIYGFAVEADPSRMPSVEDVRRASGPKGRRQKKFRHVLAGTVDRTLIDHAIRSDPVVTPAMPVPAKDRRSAAASHPVSKEWLQLGAELEFIPLRDRFAVVVADEPSRRDEDVPDRIHRLWDALKARNFERATVSVVATGMDRTTTGRVTKARAYVVKAPEGFSSLKEDERLNALREIFPAPRPVTTEGRPPPDKVVADKDVPKRYLKRNPQLSRADVARWRERYSTPAGHE